MNCTRVCLVLLLMLGDGAWLIAQQQGAPKVLRVNAPSAVAGKPQPISVDLDQNAQVSKVTLRYRSFGETSFKGMEMLLSGRTASATIPAEAILPPYVEYYIELTLPNKIETYPVEGPEANPLQFTVKAANPKDQEVRFLSPEPGETVAVEDLVIAISFFYASDAVNKKATTIFFDGVNVTAQAVWSDDVLVYSPKNFDRPLNLGAHFFRVELRDTTGKPYHAVEQSFNLSTASAIAEEKARLQSTGSANLEVRNEALSSGTTTYVRGDVRLDNTYKSVGFGGNLHLDNQEKSTLQPQNRFLLYGQTDFLRIQAGDAFPRFPSLIVSGTRVRGITGNLALGFFNLDVTYGQTVRRVEGTVDSTYSYPTISDASGRPLTTARVGNDSTRFTFFENNGKFSRNFFAIRPSFGSGENFQLGFTYMHSADDTTSVKYAIQPQENVVMGTDLTLAFDDQRVKLETQASLSLNNTDITGGSFTDAQYDSLKINTGTDLKSLGHLADKFITINQSIFPTNPVDIKTLPGVSAEATLSLNYLNNFVRGQFYRRGAGYRSFGNEFLQTDIQGFLISDYIRMFTNKVFLSLSYEGKHDNTAFTKLTGTTSYSNLNTSLILNLAANIPTFQLGYGVFARQSDQTVFAPDSTTSKAADDATNRIFFGMNYDFVAGLRHTLTANASIATKDDNTYFKRNQANSLYQLALTTRYEVPLQTTLSVIYSGNSNDQQLFTSDTSGGKLAGRDSVLATSTFNYTVVTAAALYRLLENRLLLRASVSPQFGAYKRTTLSASADYTIGQHNFTLEADYFKNSGIADDKIFSLIYRFLF
ncbi:MAG TPA: hypothetical protein VMM37_03275 [Bacteroidota bacterium]|nr:hypothetical protein [Bacteroidota bacterium]